MGVRALVRTAAVSLDELTARIETIGAVRSTGRWQVHCSYMRQAELFVCQTADMHFLVTHNQPKLPGTTAMSGDVDRSRMHVLRADNDAVAMLDQAQTHAQRLKVKIDGSVHNCSDFVIRLGQLFHNSKLSGVAMDVEYLPCAAASRMIAPLAAIIDLLLPPAERDFSSLDVECFQGVHEADLPEYFADEHAVLLLVGLVKTVYGI